MHPPQTDASFQPYGFLLTGGRRLSGMATPGLSDDSRNHTPIPPAAVEPIVHDTEHGKHLAEHLDFIIPPVISPTEEELTASSRCLFMGHLRFETTTAEVRWMIKKLCGVNPLRADIRGNGCCVVYLANDADVSAVRNLNRRVLFDHHGFWFARNGVAVDVLMDYVEKQIPRLHSTPGGKRRSLHLPKDALVVEDSRSSKHHRRHKHHDTHHSQNHSRPSSTRLSAATPRKPTLSPFSLGSSMSHGSAFANFHECPPDYVNPPSMGTSPMATPFGVSYDSPCALSSRSLR